MIEYPSVPALLGVVISKKLATLHELQGLYSYDDLLKQMKSYLKRSNNIPMQVLNWKTPLEIRFAKRLRRSME